VNAVREGGRAWKLVNFALLQGAWFGCVLGAAAGATWVVWASGLAALAAHFALVRDRRPDVALVVVAVAFGAVSETVARGVGAYDVPGDLVPAPFPPSWFLLLWAVFATAVRHCMGWMSGRYAVAVVLGAVGGPLSLSGGARLGAVTLADDAVLFWGVCGAQWAVAMPLLVRAAAALTPPSSRP
jgi:hypothetical protein